MQALRAAALAAAIFAGVAAGVLCITAARGLAPVLADLAATTSSARRTAARVDTASAQLLDCRGNPACLQSQILAAVGSGKAVAGVAARVAPDVARGAQNVAGEAARVKLSDSWLLRRAGVHVEPPQKGKP